MTILVHVLMLTYLIGAYLTSLLAGMFLTDPTAARWEKALFAGLAALFGVTAIVLGELA
jgi:hypothetical protein